MKRTGLLALDLDGVLLEGDSSWGVFHSLLGTMGPQRDRNMEMFFSGAIDYDTWARMDTALWRGKKVKPIRTYLANLQITEGARELIDEMHSGGVSSIIISTGISAVAERVGEIIGADLVRANEVEILNGRITGKVEVNCAFDQKGSILRQIARELAIPLANCACVGDHENDIPMFEVVPFSIAFNPKSKNVAEAATLIIRGSSLSGATRVLADHFGSIG